MLINFLFILLSVSGYYININDLSQQDKILIEILILIQIFCLIIKTIDELYERQPFSVINLD